MSNLKWTAAQQAAIVDRGGSLLVSAAAGSGKTAVLAERAVRLITDPVSPIDADRLLIVTFTNAAAAELRSRIGERLLAQLHAEPGNGRLQRQRMLLQRASICTIDAFCLKLIQQHFHALEIPPDFSTGDAGTMETLRQAALAETLENAYQNADFRALADQYGKGRSDAAVGAMVLQLFDHLRSRPHYAAELADGRWTGGKQALTESRKRLLWRVREAAALAGRLYAAGRDILLEEKALYCGTQESAGEKAAARRLAASYDEAIGRMSDAAEAADELFRLARKGDWDGVCAYLTPWRDGGEPLPGLKGFRKKLGGGTTDARSWSDIAADCLAEVLPLVPCTVAESEAEFARERRLLAALADAVRDFDQIYYRKKLERKVLEFSDFEHLALRLLKTDPHTRTALCAQISQGFDAVMVDEYQDTNALQDELYRALAHEEGDNLFFVGDLKQSIYRFRQADPTIFQSKLAAFAPLPPPGTPRPLNARLALDANFRSAPAVVEGVNFLFDHLMTPGLGGVEYGPGQRLVCGADMDGFAGSVEAHVLQIADAEQEADYLAERIRQMVAAGTPVRCAGGTRPLRYEDCCILLSTRTRFRIYADALQRQGVPVYADSAEDLLCAPHIRPLVALLRVIDNPAQDIYLAAAMLGPMFGFTDDDLVRLRAARGRISLYGAVLRTAQSDAEDPFTQKVRGFYHRLTALREAARTLPIDELLEEIFVSTGYLAALGAMDNGARRREDARRFAAFCAANGADGLPRLIRAIDAAMAAGGLVESAPGRARPGCVTIMTIHRSKGLQFPAVFLADTGHQFNQDDLRRPLLLNDGAGLLLRGGVQGDGQLYATVCRLAEKEAAASALRSEQMRLLYVALTRAQDHLVFTVPFKKLDAAIHRQAVLLAAQAGWFLHGHANCFADWLLSALLCHPNGRELREQTPVFLTERDTGSELYIRVRDLTEDPAAPPDTAAAEPPAPDPALVALLTEGFAWQYPDAALADLPAKVSVTSVVHRHSAATLERPAFMSAQGLSAAEMGTALHSFLQHADFAPFAAARGADRETLRRLVAEESDRQVALQLVQPRIAETLDTEKMVTFFESEAFARICAADTVLREYAFITALPAGAVVAAQGADAAGTPDAKVLVQGIADLLLIFPDHLELLDYKSDRSKTADQLVAEYRAQLNLYALAIEKRFVPKKVSYKGIYSLTLGQLIGV